MKTIKITLAILLMGSTVAVSSCNKYEEGPSLSLRTKKARLAGEWDMVAYSNGGVEVADTDSDYVTFEKDGTFKFSMEDGTSMTGKWEFANDKEAITMTYDNSTITGTSTILKLTNDELWIKDTEGTEEYITKMEKK